MTQELKTLKEIRYWSSKGYSNLENSDWDDGTKFGKTKPYLADDPGGHPEKAKLFEEYWLREEAIKHIKNLQGPDTIYPIALEGVPESWKGKIAKDKWNDTMFRYGSEYGMIAILKHFFNIDEKELEGSKRT